MQTKSGGCPRCLRRLAESRQAGQIASRPRLCEGGKDFTNKSLRRSANLPHVVGPQGKLRNNLLFAVVHRLLSRLFTGVRMYSQL
jgi:hypothetical protein